MIALLQKSMGAKILPRLTVENVRDIHMKGGSILKALVITVSSQDNQGLQMAAEQSLDVA